METRQELCDRLFNAHLNLERLGGFAQTTSSTCTNSADDSHNEPAVYWSREIEKLERELVLSYDPHPSTLELSIAQRSLPEAAAESDGRTSPRTSSPSTTSAVKLNRPQSAHRTTAGNRLQRSSASRRRIDQSQPKLLPLSQSYMAAAKLRCPPKKSSVDLKGAEFEELSPIERERAVFMDHITKQFASSQKLQRKLERNMEEEEEDLTFGYVKAFSVRCIYCIRKWIRKGKERAAENRAGRRDSYTLKRRCFSRWKRVIFIINEVQSLTAIHTLSRTFSAFRDKVRRNSVNRQLAIYKCADIRSQFRVCRCFLAWKAVSHIISKGNLKDAHSRRCSLYTACFAQLEKDTMTSVRRVFPLDALALLPVKQIPAASCTSPNVLMGSLTVGVVRHFLEDVLFKLDRYLASSLCFREWRETVRMLRSLSRNERKAAEYCSHERKLNSFAHWRLLFLAKKHCPGMHQKFLLSFSFRAWRYVVWEEKVAVQLGAVSRRRRNLATLRTCMGKWRRKTSEVLLDEFAQNIKKIHHFSQKQRSPSTLLLACHILLGNTTKAFQICCFMRWCTYRRWRTMLRSHFPFVDMDYVEECIENGTVDSDTRVFVQPGNDDLPTHRASVAPSGSSLSHPINSSSASTSSPAHEADETSSVSSFRPRSEAASLVPSVSTSLAPSVHGSMTAGSKEVTFAVSVSLTKIVRGVGPEISHFRHISTPLITPRSITGNQPILRMRRARKSQAMRTAAANSEVVGKVTLEEAHDIIKSKRETEEQIQSRDEILLRRLVCRLHALRFRDVSAGAFSMDANSVQPLMSLFTPSPKRKKKGRAKFVSRRSKAVEQAEEPPMPTPHESVVFQTRPVADVAAWVQEISPVPPADLEPFPAVIVPNLVKETSHTDISSLHSDRKVEEKEEEKNADFSKEKDEVPAPEVEAKPEAVVATAEEKSSVSDAPSPDAPITADNEAAKVPAHQSSPRPAGPSADSPLLTMKEIVTDYGASTGLACFSLGESVVTTLSPKTELLPAPKKEPEKVSTFAKSVLKKSSSLPSANAASKIPRAQSAKFLSRPRASLTKPPPTDSSTTRTSTMDPPAPQSPLHVVVPAAVPPDLSESTHPHAQPVDAETDYIRELLGTATHLEDLPTTNSPEKSPSSRPNRFSSLRRHYPFRPSTVGVSSLSHLLVKDAGSDSRGEVLNVSQMSSTENVSPQHFRSSFATLTKPKNPHRLYTTRKASQGLSREDRFQRGSCLW